MQRILVILALMGAASGICYSEESRISLEATLSSNWLLRRPVRSYQNYSFDLYSNYQNHKLPQPEGSGADEIFYPRSFYDGIGNQLMTGYDLFSWHERRQPELQWGSSIYKNEGNWTEAFKYVAIARDGYGKWGYSAIVGGRSYGASHTANSIAGRF